MKQLLTVLLALTALNASAEVIVEESGSKATFHVNGRQVSPVDAQEAARSNGTVERCMPIKDAITSDGKPAYKCKRVALVINPKTGTTKWKSL